MSLFTRGLTSSNSHKHQLPPYFGVFQNLPSAASWILDSRLFDCSQWLDPCWLSPFSESLTVCHCLTALHCVSHQGSESSLSDFAFKSSPFDLPTRVGVERKSKNCWTNVNLLLARVSHTISLMSSHCTSSWSHADGVPAVDNAHSADMIRWMNCDCNDLLTTKTPRLSLFSGL